MKVGEFYRNRFNKYVSQITKVGRNEIELVTLHSNTPEKIKREHFDNNYEEIVTVYQFEKDIREAFSFGEVKLMGDTIQVNVDDSRIEFSITNQLKVYFSDDIKEAVDSETNIMYFLLEDAFDVINMLASLFTD